MSAAPAPRRWWRAPVLRALLAQVLAYPFTVVTVWLLARSGLAPSWIGVACAQGAWAACLSRLPVRAFHALHLPAWWLPIQLAFPPAVLLAGGLALPPIAFLVVFGLFVAVFWSTFRTQVPYYPSSREVRELVASLLPARPLAMIDIGSGLGGLVLDLARRRPDCQVDDIELAPLPWLVGCLRARLAGSRARLLLGDYEHLNFDHYDVVFAYLSPAAMEGLWRKASAELRPGSLLLSYEFAIPDRQPDRRFVTTDGKKALYIWHF